MQINSERANLWLPGAEGEGKGGEKGRGKDTKGHEDKI